jgi:hypothetical protein
VEGVLEELHDVLDESPDRVRAKLVAVVPEFSSAAVTDDPISSAGKRAHAK